MCETMANPENRISLDLSSVPDYIREDVAMTVLRGYRRSIRDDPGKRQLYRKLGTAFLERRARSGAPGRAPTGESGGERDDEREANAHDEQG